MAGRTDSGSSITNVAATAGVSIATVSRVLSGKRGKDDDIARRVREAAKQLGYSVNYAASALRSDVTKTIGLVIPSATEPFSAQLLDEIEPTIDTESQQLLLGIGATQEAQAERIESLANRHVDGLIVVPAAGTDLAGTLNQYANTLPIVQICGRQTAPRVSVVGIDENAAMEAIVKHLAEQGIASAAYMAGNELSFESAELFATFHTHMRTYGLATSENWNQFGERTVQRGFDCTMRLFNGPLVQPEAVVCADDAIAFGVMVAFDALGIRVPEDVLVVGYHDSAIARTTMPRLTSVRAPFERIVSECLRLLASGPALLNVWEDIDFIDVPGKLIPEWLGVRNRPSASAAHRYTIDRHMVEVVTRLGRETPSGGRYDDRHYEALLLAGILHDIGKRPGVANHAAEGARHATVVVERMGFDRDIVRWVTLLVREHLTLSEFATGRNPNDPNVGDDLAGRLDHNPVLLDMLFDLTRADGSSLGATSGETISKQYGWSKWRETLVRTMYNATRYHM